MNTLTKAGLKLKRISGFLVFIVIGFWIGVAVNYYGLLFESIRIHVQVSAEESWNLTGAQTSDKSAGGWRGSGPRRSDGAEDLNASGVANRHYAVPNIVHYIWFAKDRAKELSFINYVSIKSAQSIQRADAILLHCDSLPSGVWWERLLKEVTLTVVYKRAPDVIHGQTISHNFHSGDVAKLEILLEYGGIYLDYDVIVVNSLNPLRRFDATLGKEKRSKFIAGIIVAKRNALFLKLLHESYRNNYRPFDWDYNCARVAYQIYLKRPDLLHVEPYKLTTPDWIDRHLLWKEVINWRHLYVVHIMTHDVTEIYTPEKIKQLNSTFGEVMRFVYYGSSKIDLPTTV